MSNEFFQHNNPFIPGTKVKSDEANGKFDGIVRAFDKLPTEQQLKSGNLNYAVDTGSANNYAVALPYPPAAYFDGLTLAFKAGTANTGSSVINVNGLGNKSILLPDGSALGAGDIPLNGVVTLVYGNGSFQFQGTSISKTNLASQKASEAAASASAAATSAANASASATSASNSATSAATSASSATGSASAASTSATNAAGSATAASGSKDLAQNWAIKTDAPVSGSEWSAKKHATDASGYATTASTKAAEASTSATNAASSASAASTSATSATTSKNAAATSATNASNSASAATASETNAATSATAAANSATSASSSASAAATSETNAHYWADQALQVAGGNIIDDSQALSTKVWSSSKVSTELAGKSDTGHAHSSASTSVSGFMSAGDKAKLDNIATQATRTVIDDAATGTGTVWSGSKVSSELAGKQATITGGASTIASANLTSSRALVSDSNGKVAGSAVTATELGYLSGVTSGVQAQLNAKLPLAGGTLTGTLIGRHIIAVGTGNDYSTGAYEAVGNGSANTVFPTIGFHQPAAYAASLQLRGATDFRFYAQGANSYADVTAANFNGSLNGNAYTATTLAGDQTNWANYRSNAVANMLGWKCYGNGHVIFDASAGTAPDGVAKNNTTPDVDWTPTYPTLMGWNGSNTYGVRVARSYQAEKCVDTGWISLSLVNGFTHQNNFHMQVRRVGNVVYLQGGVYRSTPPSGLMNFATIPAGYRPTKPFQFVATMNADNLNWTLADITGNVDGSINIGLQGIPNQNNAYWSFNTSWVTDYA